MASSSSLEQQEQQQPAVGLTQEQLSEGSQKDSNPISATDLLPSGNIAHPEHCVSLRSCPGHMGFLVQAGVYCVTLDEETNSQGIVSRTGQLWVDLNPDFAAPRERFLVHIGCTFLNRSAFRVRLGLQAFFPFPNPYPTDSDFPSPTLREYLFPSNQSTEPVAGNQRDNLVCGLELRAEDGEVWVNPRGSGWELRWDQSPFSLHASWRKPFFDSHDKEDGGGATDNKGDANNQDQNLEDSSAHVNKPIFEQAPLGPFTPTLLPNGILNIDGVIVGSELLILDVGEKIQSGGPGRHHKQDAANTGMVDSDPIPNEARRDASIHFGGRFLEEKTKTVPPPFLWSDRGWGILMKNPVAVGIAGLQDGRGMLSLLMGAGENGVLDYIILVGDALEACKQEYPVEAM